MERELNASEEEWTAKEHNILYVHSLLPGCNASSCIVARCMEHALHIACKHFVEAVAPTSPAAIRNTAYGVDSDDDGSSDADLDFSPGDALGKALALVKQVCSRNISLIL